jgi:hypothetical protein
MSTIADLKIPFENTELKKYENISQIETDGSRHMPTVMRAEKVHAHMPVI